MTNTQAFVIATSASSIISILSLTSAKSLLPWETFWQVVLILIFIFTDFLANIGVGMLYLFLDNRADDGLRENIGRMRGGIIGAFVGAITGIFLLLFITPALIPCFGPFAVVWRVIWGAILGYIGGIIIEMDQKATLIPSKVRNVLGQDILRLLLFLLLIISILIVGIIRLLAGGWMLFIILPVLFGLVCLHFLLNTSFIKTMDVDSPLDLLLFGLAVLFYVGVWLFQYDFVDRNGGAWILEIWVPNGTLISFLENSGGTIFVVSLVGLLSVYFLMMGTMIFRQRDKILKVW